MSDAAKTILQQLGGNKFVAMTGAKDFVALERGGLQFNLPRAEAGINRVQIVLVSDLYTMAFYKQRGLTCKEARPAIHAIGVEQLRKTFENATGLYTNL